MTNEPTESIDTKNDAEFEILEPVPVLDVTSTETPVDTTPSKSRIQITLERAIKEATYSVQECAEKSTKLQQKITASKTNAKKDLYKRKLRRNNKIFSSSIETLNAARTLLDAQLKKEKEKEK